jgi:Domain of unknown function (DUF3291)
MSHLAQINIGRMLAPLSDPLMAGFVAKLDEVNALADSSKGFIWRLQSGEGNATDIQAYDDEMILVNMSVWASLEDLSQYVYAMESEHRHVMKQRRKWFERFDGPFMVLWWIPEGHIPTVEEAKERLEHLRTHGESAYAFSFKKPFPAPDTQGKSLPKILDECPT